VDCGSTNLIRAKKKLKNVPVVDNRRTGIMRCMFGMSLPERQAEKKQATG